MNSKEETAVAHLVSMREKYGAVAVKAEFEAEGTRFSELLRLKLLASAAGLNVMLKIGGPEDVWGILQARMIDPMGIVAPMVESSYALRKYLEAAHKHIPQDERKHILLAVNVETKMACDNLAAMLDVGRELGLNAATLGRVDLVGSMGLERGDINSPAVFRIVRAACNRIRKAGLEVTLGGGIEIASRDFIKSLVEEGLLDRFETRKIIFDGSMVETQERYEEAIKAAHYFEILWLENKNDSYAAMAAEDADRIPMLWKRVR